MRQIFIFCLLALLTSSQITPKTPFLNLVPKNTHSPYAGNQYYIDKSDKIEENVISRPPTLKKAISSSYDLKSSLNFSVAAQYSSVNLNSKKEQIIPILINLGIDDLTNQEQYERSPIDLVCVIDHSGSMQGQKIELVKKTLRNLLQFTNKYDRLSLIQFDDEVELLTPFVHTSENNLNYFYSKINSIQSDGSTDITGGMTAAFDIIKRRKSSNPITSIFLLTDGLDNARGDAFSKIQNALKSFGIIDEAFSINCFGFGNDHDDKLLVRLAKLKSGSFYYIEKLNRVNEAFADALGGLLSVVSLQSFIKIKEIADTPFSAIKLRNTYGDKWSKIDNNNYEIQMSQLLAGTQKGFVAELVIPPLASKTSIQNRDVAVLSVGLVAYDNEGKSKIEKNSTLTLRLLNEN